MSIRTPVTHLALLSFLAFSVPLHADDGTTEQLVTFSGFGTIGAVHNQGDGSAFLRDMGQMNGATNRGLNWTIDSRIGIQGTIKPTENLEVVAQVISRYRADNNFQPELTLGFIKYSPNETVTVRAGRVGYDIFLAADSRDVGYSYLWVRPPVDYYGADPTPYIDGGDIVFHAPIGEGLGRLKLYSGIGRQQVPVLAGQTQWAGNITQNMNVMEDLSGSRFTGGQLDYQDNNWTFRLGRADMRTLHEIPSFPIGDPLASIRLVANIESQSNPALANSLNTLANDLAFGNKHFTFTSFGITYEKGPLRTEMAVNHLKSESLLFSAENNGYLSVGYRYGKFTPYAVISAARTKKNYRADNLAGQGATPFDAMLVNGAVGVANFMITTGEQSRHTFSLGTRYDITSNVALKFQVDMIRNNTCSPVSLPSVTPPYIGPAAPCAPPVLFPSVPVSWDGHANVYTAVLDFTF